MGILLGQSVIDGLLIGGVYATVAVGLSLAFGVMRIINWAQGELLMISMYVSYFLFDLLGLDPYVNMFLVMGLMFAVGYFMQETVISNLLARETVREPISVLLFTSGLGMVLTNAALIVFGSAPKTALTPLSGKMIAIGDMLISLPKIISFSIALCCTIALFFFLQRTETGRAIRAISQNRQVATLMGINQKRVFSIAFGISIALVGLSGALLIPYFPVGTTVGQTFSFRSFVIVVLGGKGSVIGALLGGLIVGVIEKVGGHQYQSGSCCLTRRPGNGNEVESRFYLSCFDRNWRHLLCANAAGGRPFPGIWL